MNGYCNNCGSTDVDVDRFTCSTCIHLHSVKDDDGRRYGCENDQVTDAFKPIINSETIHRFACNRYEPENN